MLVDKIGLDAAVFLRFLRMMRWLFTAVAFLTCAVLIPVNVSYNLRNVKSSDRDALSFLTIRDVQGKILFVHVGMTYIITFTVIGFVWFNWKQVVRLRNAWFRSPEYVQSFYARTLMVHQVPKKFQSDEGIRAIFESVQVPYPTTSVHIGRRVGKLPELLEFHNETVKELEAVLVEYLKDGKIGKKRPTKRLGGWMCFGGQRVDAIDYYRYVPHGFLMVDRNNGMLFTAPNFRGLSAPWRNTAPKSTRTSRRTTASRPWPRSLMLTSSQTS